MVNDLKKGLENGLLKWDEVKFDKILLDEPIFDIDNEKTVTRSRSRSRNKKMERILGSASRGSSRGLKRSVKNSVGLKNPRKSRGPSRPFRV